MQQFDYIISGMGAAGLSLAYRMANDSFFDSKSILLLDKDLKSDNDHTWCYWEKESNFWDAVVSKKWEAINFYAPEFSNTIPLEPYQYKHIKSSDFYQYTLAKISKKSNFTIVNDTLLSIKDHSNSATVYTQNNNYQGLIIFNSIVLSKEYEDQQEYPVINQHFVGWFIETVEPLFDDKAATFMDFTVPQKGNTRFMYVLPTSTTTALFEYTLFSKDLLEKNEYENAIRTYLKEKGISNYKITEKEQGCIPMTCYNFSKQKSSVILNIGTAGGWTKPSTGYTFMFIQKKVDHLITVLKNNDPLAVFYKKTRFWFYDLLFIDVLYHNNHLGAKLFTHFFKKNSAQKILKFLDEETSVAEEIKIITSLPKRPFLKALLRRVFTKVS